MSTITELALQAEREAAKKQKQQNADKRQKLLAELQGHWDRTALDYFNKEDPKAQPMPDDDQFVWVGSPGFTHGYPGSRNPHVYGWTWETDGVRFVYDAYNGQGCCVILTCPDCGEEHAANWYGLSSLGKLLRTQRDTGHTCREVVLRELAYAIRSASERTKLSPQSITAMALERGEVWPR